MNQQIKSTIEAFERNGIRAKFFEHRKDAIAALMAEIQPKDKVGIGGSVTIRDLGIPELIREQGNELFYHWFETTPEGVATARKNALSSDIYLAGANAVTEDGKLVNMDGHGNRVAAMIFGPKKVFIIAGVNKLVKDEAEGIQRIRDHAWKNAVRLGLSTPCVTTKKCSECNHPQRMCNALTVIKRKPATDLTLFIIGEELGY